MLARIVLHLHRLLNTFEPNRNWLKDAVTNN